MRLYLADNVIEINTEEYGFRTISDITVREAENHVFDVPCSTTYRYICSIRFPKKLAMSYPALLIGNKSAEWPGCIYKDRLWPAVSFLFVLNIM
jgi:hypothetical protein